MSKSPSVPFAEDPKWNVIEFETTPVMSTYLLAYIVCEFTSVKTVAPNNVQVGIWARPNAIAENHGNYALNVTGPILNFFAKHFDTPYPLPKSVVWELGDPGLVE